MENLRKILMLVCIVVVSIVACTKEVDKKVEDENYGGISIDEDGNENNTVIGEKDQEDINAAYAKIEELIKSVKNVDELSALLSQITAIPAVEKAWVEGGELSVKFKKGGVVSWVVFEEKMSSSSIKTGSLDALLKAIEESTVDGTGLKVLLVNQESNNETKAEYKTYVSNIKAGFIKKKFTVSVLNGTAFNLDYADSELSKYDFIFFVTLGSYFDGLHWIYTGEEMSESDNLDDVLKDKYAEWNKEAISVSSIKETREGVEAWHRYLRISEHFVNDHYKDNKFNNTCVYSSAGKLFRKDDRDSEEVKNSFARAFVDNGAAIFMDWDRFHSDGVSIGSELFLKLLEAKTIETIVDDLVKDGKDMSYLEYYPISAKDFRINNEPGVFKLMFPGDKAENVSTSLKFNWQKAIDINGDDVTYDIKVYKKDDESDFFESKDIKGDTYDAGSELKIMTDYCWYVVAKDKLGEEKKSATFTFSTINEMPKYIPIAPKDEATDIDRKVALRWEPGDYLKENDVTYNIYYGTSKSFGDPKFTGITEYEAVVEGLAEDTKYYWQVVANDEAKNEYPSDVWSFTTGGTLNTPPSKPELLGPSNGEIDVLFTDINFRWNPCIDENGDLLKYSVWCKKKGETSWAKWENISTTTIKRELKANTEYSWKVLVFDGPNNPPVESDVFVFETRVNTSPSAPVLVGPKNDESNLGTRVRFEWEPSTDVDGEIPTYNLVVTDDSGNEVINESLTVCSFEYILDLGYTYSWYVFALDGNYGKKSSEEWSFRLKNLPNLEGEGLMFVEGGKDVFDMGSNSGDPDEVPVRRISLRDFYMSKNEVTHAEYIKFLNAEGVGSDGYYGGEQCIDIKDVDCSIKYEGGTFAFKTSRYAETDDTPVILVTWAGANAYCEWLSNKSGNKYRLPTEAEWEYAARGGIRNKGYTYSGGNSLNDLVWYSGNSDNKIHSVGTKKANELGIFDMNGNVWEWCSDWYGADYYSSGDVDNPTGPTGSTGVTRVIRGSSWLNDNTKIGVSHRSHNNPTIGGVNLGFRIVRDTPDNP